MRLAPTKDQPPNHTQAHGKRSQVVHVSTLAYADARVERNWTFDQPFTVCEGDVEEVSIEFQIHSRIQHRHETLQRAAAHKLVSSADIRKRPSSQVFQLEQFSDEEVSVVHERR